MKMQYINYGKEVFLKERVAICGIVKAEIMHGAKNELHLNIINKALSGFEYIPINESLWEMVGVMLCRLRKRGITVPFQDVVISALALKYDISIWANDRHFAYIKEIFNNLKLFKLN